MKLLLVLFGIYILLCPITFAQVSQADQDEFIAKTIDSLGKYNVLRQALERGKRGDGIHHKWMDEMKDLNIKQAAFVFNFKWDGKSISDVDMTKVMYLNHYYKYDSLVENKDDLIRIERDGLAKKLRCEAEEKARIFLGKVLNKYQPGFGIVYINLLDDERLPLMIDLPDINYNN